MAERSGCHLCRPAVTVLLIRFTVRRSLAATLLLLMVANALHRLPARKQATFITEKDRLPQLPGLPGEVEGSALY